jgi:hypothetical protein
MLTVLPAVNLWGGTFKMMDLGGLAFADVLNIGLLLLIMAMRPSLARSHILILAFLGFLMMYPVAAGDFSTTRVLLRYQLVLAGALVFWGLTRAKPRSALKYFQTGILVSYCVVFLQILVPSLLGQEYANQKSMVTLMGIIMFSYRMIIPSSMWSWRIIFIISVTFAIVMQVKAVILGVLIYFAVKRAKRRIFLLTLGLLLIVFVTVFVGNLGMEMIETDQSNSARVYFLVAAAMVTDSTHDFLLGPGYAAWQAVIQAAAGDVLGISNEFSVAPNPHNLLLELYINGGLLLTIVGSTVLYKLYVLLGCSPAFAGAVVAASFTTMTGLDRSVVTILLGCTLSQIYVGSRIGKIRSGICRNGATCQGSG